MTQGLLARNVPKECIDSLGTLVRPITVSLIVVLELVSNHFATLVMIAEFWKDLWNVLIMSDAAMFDLKEEEE